MRLERPPAREPIVSGERELRVGQLRGWTLVPQSVQAALRLLAEPIEIGVVGKGQRSGRRSRDLFGHETPSFLGKGASPFSRPSSATGRGTEGCVTNYRDGLNPLRGPSASLVARV